MAGGFSFLVFGKRKVRHSIYAISIQTINRDAYVIIYFSTYFTAFKRDFHEFFQLIRENHILLVTVTSISYLRSATIIHMRCKA